MGRARVHHRPHWWAGHLDTDPERVTGDAVSHADTVRDAHGDPGPGTDVGAASDDDAAAADDGLADVLHQPGGARPRFASAPGRRQVGHPTLDWRYGGTCTPGGFEVQVARNRAMTQIERTGTVDGSTTQWTVDPPLADCTQYYWRVRAVTGRIQGPSSDVYALDVATGRCP